MKNIFLVLSLVLSPIVAIAAQSKFEILESCEGEGCGCTRKETTNQKFVVYSEMDKSSKVLGKFGAATKASAGKLRTKVIQAGKAKIVEVKNPKIGLKVGDIVTHIFNAAKESPK